MATRYLSGGTLANQIEHSGQERGLSVADVIRIGREITRALAHIHSNDIVWGDLQPKNVRLDDRRSVHLVDFDTAIASDGSNVGLVPKLSDTPYLAPELLDGTRPDARSDLFALGVTLHEMCVGPSHRSSPADSATTPQVPPAISRQQRPDIPKELHRLIEQLLAIDPAERPDTAEEVAECFERLETRRLRRPDLDSQIRAEFPFPIALPWLHARTSPRHLEGYVAVLECANPSLVILLHLGSSWAAIVRLNWGR